MSCVTPYFVKKSDRYVGKEEHYPVPCGQCVMCRRRRVNQWVFRLQQEDKVQPSAYFITLTYDTDNVPMTNSGLMTLVSTIPHPEGKEHRLPHPKSFQAFVKRLRKFDNGKIKYYACGEYGTSKHLGRPHYHAIIFGVLDENNIFKAWQFGKAHIGTVTEESIAYTAKYIDKNKTIPAFAADDRMKEFSLMSKKIGINYVEENVEITSNDGTSRTYKRVKPSIKEFYTRNLDRNFVRTGNGYKVALPRYFAQRIFTEEENEQRRIIAAKNIRESESRARTEHWNKYKGLKFTPEDAKEQRKHQYCKNQKSDQWNLRKSL